MKLIDRENWTRRTVLGGLGWAYSVMLFTEIVNYFGFTQSSYWRWEVVVIKLVIWTLFGLTFGRWLLLKMKRPLEQKK
ncbi:hypothetical protein [uncultured Rikenella sp.]|uniref:hypothetical protein n=1 Tax=uncultured Rikenella sp. TaxID=368003 RepID=UPI00263500A4|nr:hypothetical protein [uncultured Rikenella sp.]